MCGGTNSTIFFSGEIELSQLRYRCTTQVAKLSFNHSIGRTYG